MKNSIALIVALLALLSIVLPGGTNVLPPQRNATHDLEHDELLLVPLAVNAPTWSAVFHTSTLNMTMTDTKLVALTINYIDPAAWGEDFELHIKAVNSELLDIERIVTADEIPKGQTSWTGKFNVTALFLGHTRIVVELHRANFEPERSQQALDVIIMRNEGVLDTAFKLSVGIFVMVLYVNFGAALDLNSLKDILLKPVGPVIGFVGQFVLMPLISFSIGYFMFHDMIELRLGLFFQGTTPGGGASNIFTVILGGNLDLSITMTTISNLAAFGMMPLWIFTLGAFIFRDGNFTIPYDTIAMMSFSLVVPVGLGIAIQRFAPNFANKMAKSVKPISLVLIIFITVFAFTVNSYIFKLFTWRILVASSALPWFGYLVGWLLAVLCGQSQRDALTIAIETGIQNTGIAIFMLCFTLPQPQADITSAVPVASSMMTPLPLLALYLLQRCFKRVSIEEVEEAPTKEGKAIEVEKIMAKGKANAGVQVERL